MKTFLAVSCACLLVFAIASPALACDDCPEQGQWLSQTWYLEFEEGSMGSMFGSLDHDMGQWMCQDGVFMEQCQEAYGNFSLEIDGLKIYLESSGWQSQSSQ